jgi:hypothetical protein
MEILAKGTEAPDGSVILTLKGATAISDAVSGLLSTLIEGALDEAVKEGKPGVEQAFFSPNVDFQTYEDMTADTAVYPSIADVAFNRIRAAAPSDA